MSNRPARKGCENILILAELLDGFFNGVSMAIKNINRRLDFKAFIVILFIPVGNLPDDFTWSTCRHDIGGDIFRDDAARADNGILSNRNPRVDNNMTTDPHIVFYCDGERKHLAMFS